MSSHLTSITSSLYCKFEVLIIFEWNKWSPLHRCVSYPTDTFFLFFIPCPLSQRLFRLSFFQPSRSRRRFFTDTFLFLNPNVCCYPGLDLHIRFSLIASLSLCRYVSVSLCLSAFACLDYLSHICPFPFPSCCGRQVNPAGETTYY